MESEVVDEKYARSKKQPLQKKEPMVDEIKKVSTIPHFESDSDSSNIDEDTLCWAMKLLSSGLNTPEAEGLSDD